MATRESPWTSGPAELLKHAAALLSHDSDTHRRIAMILVDNAVEQAIKTYLSLPKRVTGIGIPRRQLIEISDSFPALLDALDSNATDKLDGIDLGAIEWYHRLRNELYHQGFGLTVERDKVEVYAELARTLFRNLFGETPSPRFDRTAEAAGRFIELWNRLERTLASAAGDHVLVRPSQFQRTIQILRGSDVLSPEELKRIDRLRQIRNQVVHAAGDYKTFLTEELLGGMQRLVEEFENLEGTAPSAGE